MTDAMAAGRQAMAQAVAEVTRAAARFDQVEPALDAAAGHAGPGGGDGARQVRAGRGQAGRHAVASTGTPAFFVHAADALHGDAGMVAPGDVLLAISKSGTHAGGRALRPHGPGAGASPSSR